MAESQPGEQAQDHRAGHVDGQGAEREVAAGTVLVNTGGHGAVGQEAEHRPRAADQHHGGPQHDAHARTRTRRTTAVARWIAAYPAAMLAAV